MISFLRIAQTLLFASGILALATAGVTQAQTGTAPAVTPPAVKSATVTLAASASSLAECAQVADRAKALAACSAIIKERNSDNASLIAAYRGRASASVATQKAADGLADLSRALVLDPKNADLWVARGDVRAGMGQRIRSAADYSVALKYDPKKVAALTGRAEQFRLLGALQKAVGDHSAALQLDAKSAAAYAGRAYAQQRLGKDKEAMADADEALKLDPKSVQAYLARGLASEKTDKVKAIADLKKALELDPASVIAKSSLQKLGG